MQKIFILLFVSYSLVSCGTTQYAEDATTSSEEVINPETDIQVIEVDPGKVEGSRPITIRKSSEVGPE